MCRRHLWSGSTLFSEENVQMIQSRENLRAGRLCFLLVCGFFFRKQFANSGDIARFRNFRRFFADFCRVLSYNRREKLF